MGVYTAEEMCSRLPLQLQTRRVQPRNRFISADQVRYLHRQSDISHTDGILSLTGQPEEQRGGGGLFQFQGDSPCQVSTSSTVLTRSPVAHLLPPSL